MDSPLEALRSEALAAMSAAAEESAVGLAGVIFLGPVYFAGLLFATLIENEASFYQAYASNVLGAMVGGACEYLSIVVGFKVLVLLTLAIYVATVLSLRKHLRAGNVGASNVGAG